ncbi:MAG: hypothetical protein H0T99_07610 [Geodermatophilaceae bacterium]|nr:hypothetical protein [Geodermatophilaceae bacterium]
MDHEPQPLSSPFASTVTRRTVLKGIGTAATLAAWAPSATHAQGQTVAPTPVTGHPRLWLTEADLPRLRGWATEANPVWRDGLIPLADALREQMDAGNIPGGDDGGLAWTEYPTENAAQYFAFMSLVHPDEAARADYAERARTLLMYAIGEAAKGSAEGQPFRDPSFSVFDRSRWWGAGFPLTVDWIYPLLTTEDKATIRDVFLRWIEENTTATVTGEYNHPQPVGVVNDPVLLADPVLRWVGNNYFTAHMRNIGLMALAFDAVDDPDGVLTGNLAQATGAWLYMVDALLRGDSRGGLTAEGFEYTPLALSYVVHFLLALHTAGQADPATWGPQVALNDTPFWDELIPAYLHSLSPAPVVMPDLEYVGPVYQPAWYGDGEIYLAPDFIGLLGALGRYDDLTGNAVRLDTIRWIQTHLQAGGADALAYRVSFGMQDTHIGMFYFLLFDPDAPAGADPRPTLPLAHFAPGIGRLLVRTSWEEDATWFTYALGWSTVDHQHADGNQFEFYRAGEWLTKERTGYGFNIGSSDYHNTLALENDPPDHNSPDDYRYDLWQRGSQWMIVAGGDPVILGQSIGDDYVYALGDATNLYNSEVELSTDIAHASRSIVWLQPDHIVVYDRAASKAEGRFKRFWLNLPAEATVAGSVATMTTAGGQQLVVTTLLPADAEIAAEPAETLEEAGEVAVGEPMQFRLRVEAPGGPRETRFLHVLQGADAGTAADPITLVESGAGTPFVGAVVAGTAVLFPVDAGVEVGELTYAAPAGTARHLVTGLVPGGGYDVETQAANGEVTVTIRPGSAQQADDGGVLVVEVA